MKIFRYSLVAMLAIAFCGSQAVASLTFSIGDHTSGSFSASSIHSVSAGENNKTSGPVSNALFGSVTGDFTSNLNGDVFGITGGSMSGTAGSVLGGNAADPLDVVFTGGQLKFYTDAKKTVGGYIDYKLVRNGSDVTGGVGTFFFKNIDLGFNANEPGPNRWIGSVLSSDIELTLWGNNWATSNYDWNFLNGGAGNEGLNYGGIAPTRLAQTTADSNFIALGTDIFGSVPEPLSLAVWGGLIAAVGLRRRRYSA